LNPVAQKIIQGMRTVTDEMDFFAGIPLNHVIADKNPNEAYCRGIEGKEYLFYFTNGGDIKVNINLPGGKGNIRWLSLDRGNWGQEATIQEGEGITISAPDQGNWIALIQ
jgi:hypothetical protein